MLFGDDMEIFLCDRVRLRAVTKGVFQVIQLNPNYDVWGWEYEQIVTIKDMRRLFHVHPELERMFDVLSA